MTELRLIATKGCSRLLLNGSLSESRVRAVSRRGCSFCWQTEILLGWATTLFPTNSQYEGASPWFQRSKDTFPGGPLAENACPHSCTDGRETILFGNRKNKGADRIGINIG